jgi:hypothetical protein
MIDHRIPPKKSSRHISALAGGLDRTAVRLSGAAFFGTNSSDFARHTERLAESDVEFLQEREMALFRFGREPIVELLFEESLSFFVQRFRGMRALKSRACENGNRVGEVAHATMPRHVRIKGRVHLIKAKVLDRVNGLDLSA